MKIDPNLRPIIQSNQQQTSPLEQKASDQANATNQNSDSMEHFDPNSYSAIHSEIAGALGVSESDPLVDQTYTELAASQASKQDDDRVARNQAIIDAALKYGRRVVETSSELPGFSRITEFIPEKDSSTLGKVYVRIGNEITKDGETIRNIRYYDDGQLTPLGMVTSVIKDGTETVTNVVENVPGSIDLKPGDTRSAPGSSSSDAGVKPSTWDPKQDGSFGTASGGEKTEAASNEEQQLSAPPLVSADVTTIHKEGDGQWEPGASQVSIEDLHATVEVETPDQASEAKSDPSEWQAYPGSNSGGSNSSGGTSSTQGSNNSTQGTGDSNSSTSSTDNTAKTDDTETDEEIEEEEELEQNDDDSGSGFTNDYGDNGFPSWWGNPMFHLPGGAGVGGGDSMDPGDDDDSAPGVNPGGSSSVGTHDDDDKGPTKPAFLPYTGDFDTIVNPRAYDPAMFSILGSFDIGSYTPDDGVRQTKAITE
jgi:hypothetical protein